MKIVSQSVVDRTPTAYYEMVKLIYELARVSYQAEPMAKNHVERCDFISKRIEACHESVLEHCVINVIITCNRGVSHELVRHRIAAYTQESTRFCNYSKSRFDSQLTFIRPCFIPEITEGEYVELMDVVNATKGLSPWATLWMHSCLSDEKNYMTALAYGAKPQEARDILPNALKTTVAATYNIRAWREMLGKRSLGLTGKPHPQMQEVADMILDKLAETYAAFFYDLKQGRDDVSA